MKTKKMIMVVLAVMMMAMFASVALAENVTLSGMVQRSDQGPVLAAGGQNYLLDGDNMEELEQLVGKNVSITGTIEDGEGETKILVVASYKEVK